MVACVTESAEHTYVASVQSGARARAQLQSRDVVQTIDTRLSSVHSVLMERLAGLKNVARTKKIV